MLLTRADLILAELAGGGAQRQVEIDRLVAFQDRREERVIGVRRMSRADRLARIERDGLRKRKPFDCDDLVAGLDAGRFGGAANREAHLREIILREDESCATSEHE